MNDPNGKSIRLRTLGLTPSRNKVSLLLRVTTPFGLQVGRGENGALEKHFPSKKFVLKKKTLHQK